MRALVLFLAMLPQDRVDIPDEVALKVAEKTIREVYKDDFAKKTASDRRELARKLFEEGRRTQEDLAARFVLFREARDLSANLCDVELAQRAVLAISVSFIVNAMEMKLAVLTTVEKNAKTPAEYHQLAEGYSRIANELTQADRVEEADKAIASALQIGRKAKELPLVARLEARAKEIGSLKSRFDKVRRARELHAMNPQDPAAIGEIGNWQCLIREDWEGGLPLVNLGLESPFKGLAVRDLANPTDANECLALADAWWEFASKEIPGPKESLRRRAAHWYRKASPGLTGLLKLKAEGRAIEVAAEPGKVSSWIDANDPGAFGQKGKPGDPIELDGPNINGKFVVLQKWPAGDFDAISVRIRFKGERAAFAIITPAPKCQFSFRPESCSAVRMNENNSPLELAKGLRGEAKDIRVVTIVIVEGEFVFYADGVEAGRLKAPIDKFTSLELRALGGIVEYDRVRLRKRE